MTFQTGCARIQAGIPRGGGSVVVLSQDKVVDDAGRGPVTVGDGCLHPGDPVTAGSAVSCQNAGRTGVFAAEHQGQNRPVHLGVVVDGAHGSAVNGDGVGGISKPSVQSLIVIAGHRRRAGDELALSSLKGRGVSSLKGRGVSRGC